MDFLEMHGLEGKCPVFFFNRLKSDLNSGYRSFLQFLISKDMNE